MTLKDVSCGLVVSQSIVLIAVCKKKQQQQLDRLYLRRATLYICQMICIYSPPENTSSGSVDVAAVLLVIPTFSK